MSYNMLWIHVKLKINVIACLIVGVLNLDCNKVVVGFRRHYGMVKIGHVEYVPLYSVWPIRSQGRITFELASRGLVG